VRTPGTAACSTPSHLLPNGTTDGPCVTPATSYLLGVSTRRMEKLVQQLGINRLSKSQVSLLVIDLDAQVRNVPHLATGCRPVHSPRRRRLDDEGAGGRSGGQRRLPGRDRVNATATMRSSAWRSAQLCSKPAGCSSSAA
jgi:hypothetical protein